MAESTITTTTPNPTNLPPRYQIRPLLPSHSLWATAIVAHSNAFHSTVFPLVYPDDKTARFNAVMKTAAYLVDHQIASGLSFGVFDTEYRYRSAAAAEAGGAFHWDGTDDTLSGAQLLEAMDFPLVSVALAYDGADALDMARLKPLIAALPIFGTVYHHLDQLDPRPAESWKAEGRRGEVLMRNATSTRADYEGKGLMAALARYLMREAAGRGYRAANIECLNDAVTHVWAEPPVPFKGEVVASFRSEEYEEAGDDGVVVRPFGTAKQRITRVYTTFKD